MTIIGPFGGAMAITQRKKLGSPGYFGKLTFGFGLYGLSFDRAGIYQQRTVKKGEALPGRVWHYHKQPIRMKFYKPTYRRTEAQAARRDLFQTAISAWQALTAEQKKAYNVIAHRKSRTGYNLFISEAMLS
jgi:hypothetical protein